MSPIQAVFGVMKAAVLAALLISSAFGQDMNDAIDQTIRRIRAAQNGDGSYGPEAEQPEATAHVLIALATSPRQYTVSDGPFIRDAADWLADLQTEDGTFPPDGPGDVIRSTALAATALVRVDASRYAQNISNAVGALARELERAERALDPRTQLALAMAVAATGANGTLSVKSVPSGDTPPSLLAGASRALAGREIPAPPVHDWMDLLMKDVDGLSAEKADQGVALKLLAASLLFSHLEKKESAPPHWAHRVGTLAAGLLPPPEAAAPNEPLDVQKASMLVSALSVCSRSREAAPPKAAATPDEPPLPPVMAKPLPLDESVALALDFFAANQTGGRFGFMGIEDPGITAMALSAAIRGAGLLNRDVPEYADEGLDYLRSLQKDDGSVYLNGLKTYVTSVALMAFRDSADPAYEDAIQKAARFLIVVQSDEGEGYSMEEDPLYGGMGYGGDERPDLSNTQLALEALKESEADGRQAAFAKAIRFLEKCQNRAETNPTEVVLGDGKKVVAGTDGGGIYYPGNSKAGLEEIDDGVFVARSYGSMTYALLKSLLFAGLDKEDKRVQAAVKWVQNNYTIEENPGFVTRSNPDAAQQGLFYYYMTMARALDTLGVDVITDGDGVEHRWKKELADRILALQRTDGSWINARSPRWFEGNPVLATSYALLVLDVCAE